MAGTSPAMTNSEGVISIGNSRRLLLPASVGMDVYIEELKKEG
jgi:hypothetical protein